MLKRFGKLAVHELESGLNDDSLTSEDWIWPCWRDSLKSSTEEHVIGPRKMMRI